MRKGTTPTHIFNTSIDLTNCSIVSINYSQADGSILIKKKKSDDSVTIESDKIKVALSESDTLMFNANLPAFVQVRGKYPDGKKVASNIISFNVSKLLKDEVLD